MLLGAFDLLKALRERYPLSNGRHHSVTLDDGGLVLCVWKGIRPLTFVLDDTDLVRDVADILTDIDKLVENAA